MNFNVPIVIFAGDGTLRTALQIFARGPTNAAKLAKAEVPFHLDGTAIPEVTLRMPGLLRIQMARTI